ncbi:MAG TPA: hypothetical protein DCM86_05685, partial [Verrucomicrobiales bacterium]|nr:hypothetical protein [Verrucomicrobiales bacterium]
RAPGETLVHLEATPAIPGMRWFKLQRSGELISGYRSRDGARWVLASQTRLPLPKSLWCGVAAAGLTDARTHSAVFEHVAVARRFPSPYRVQAELRSGSMVEAPGLDFDEEVLRFHGTQSRPAVRREHLARLLFQPVPGRLEPRLRLGQPGVLVTSGDFLEGEVRGLADGWILLDSVLSGARRLDVINQVTAVVLWPATRGRAPYEIRMRDGSIWRATSAAISGHALRIQEPLLGECELPLPDLLSFEAPAR